VGKPISSGVRLMSSIKNKPVGNRTIRYSYNDSTAAQIINNIDLLNILAFFVNGSTSAYGLFESVRLLRVGVTGFANSTTGVSSVGFEWLGNNSPASLTEMILTVGVPCHRNFFPPEDSSSSWWWGRPSRALSVDIFRISMGTFTVAPTVFIDLEIQYVLDDGDCAVLSLGAAATATGLYYVGLPLGGTSSADFIPVGLATIP
jgi:hypothetical protein